MNEPAKPATQDEDAGSADIHNALLDSIEWIARHHGLNFSPEVALHGVPLVDGRMTIAQLETAFGNVGLSSRIVRKSPSDVPLIVCPYLVFFAGGDVGIVTGRRGKRGKFDVVSRVSEIRRPGFPLRDHRS